MKDTRLEDDARRRQEIADRYAREEAARRVTLEKLYQESTRTQFVQLKAPSPSPTPRKK